MPGLQTFDPISTKTNAEAIRKVRLTPPAPEVHAAAVVVEMGHSGRRILCRTSSSAWSTAARRTCGAGSWRKSASSSGTASPASRPPRECASALLRPPRASPAPWCHCLAPLFVTDAVAAAQTRFLVDNRLSYTPVSQEDFAAVRDKLLDTAMSQAKLDKANEVLHAGFYLVPFEDVVELVRHRRVFLKGGKAFVPAEQLGVLVVGAFRAALSKAATLTARQWAARTAGEEAERLAPIVEALSMSYLGSDFSAGGEGGAGFALADLAAAAEASFPLCMRNLTAHLKEDHHLRHAGRMQLGLFLKGVGLNLEDAMQFWRSEFCRKITPEQFEKQYSYNIRHNYGREGKRQDYTPYSCLKICSATPGAGEHHGCPYRTFNEDSLRAALRAMKLPSAAVDEALEKAKNRHYQIACGVTFAAKHGRVLDEGVQHPNQYFKSSREALGLAPKSAEAEPITPQDGRLEPRPLLVGST